MKRAIRAFLRGNSGAVTVDWVVLTAAVAGLGIASVAAVHRGSEGLGTTISARLGAMLTDGSRSGAYEFLAMTDEGHWWNNHELRRAQMAGMTDTRLMHEWEHYVLRYFDRAIESRDNSVCSDCRGAANRLDLMRVTLDEMETRGLATQDHRATMARSIQTYWQTFD